MRVLTSSQCLQATRACLHTQEDTNNEGAFRLFHKAMLSLKRYPGKSGSYIADEQSADIIEALADYQTMQDLSAKAARSYATVNYRSNEYEMSM